MYGRHNESFGMIHYFESCESEHCNIVTPLGFATGLNLNRAERLTIKLNQDENNYRRPQIMNGHYSTMSVNGASTIRSLVSTAIHQ
jgi:hypothetical protein